MFRQIDLGILHVARAKGVLCIANVILRSILLICSYLIT